VRYSFIHAEKTNHPITLLCRAFNVSESGFHAWQRRSMSRRQREDMILLAYIRCIHQENYQSYGRERMTEELRSLDFVVSERRVARLMKDNNIHIKRTHKFKRTTDSDHNHNVAPNLLEGDFTTTGPNQKWAGDITYIQTQEGWLYLAVIIDLYSRRVIGWAVSKRMKRDLVMQALQRAIALRKPPKGVIHHSDRGSQYCSRDYRKLLEKHGFEASMSGKGNCYDNATVETFFKSLKAELVWRTNFETRDQAGKALFKYINKFYNTRRRHSYLGNISPMKFEMKAA
jgi:transposase InsO family protein